MLALLGTVLFATSALAGNDGPIPPHLKACANITIQSEGNCPKRNYECDETLTIRYKVRNDNWAAAEVKCVDRKAFLAVDNQIVDRIRCRGQKWRAEGNCDIPTTTVVCAKYCGADACPASVRHANTSKYERLNVYDATTRSKCAYAQCKYGFVALTRNGDFIKDFPTTTSVTCSGNGEWAVSATEKHAHLMCKKRPESCECDDGECNPAPWSFPHLNATSTAIRDGCKYSCPAGQVLSRKNEQYAIAITSATCTRDGYLTTGDKIVKRIGCSTCDVPDGEIVTLPRRKKAVVKNCVLSCPRGYALRYGLSDDIKFAPGNVMYRQFNVAANGWITEKGVVINKNYWFDCLKKRDNHNHNQ